jgi:IMP dehydrogenase
LKELTHFFPNDHFIAGNIVTADAARELVDAGATGLKVGIGPGAVCTTRLETGAGVPQITAIMNVANAVRSSCIPVIADGGCRSAGDVVKALAAGAHAVMSGFLFAGTDETPTTGRYSGMASGECKKNWNNDTSHIEGTTMTVPDKGPVSKIVEHLLDGIRSGISYSGATDIQEMHDLAEFISLK